MYCLWALCGAADKLGQKCWHEMWKWETPDQDTTIKAEDPCPFSEKGSLKKTWKRDDVGLALEIYNIWNFDEY